MGSIDKYIFRTTLASFALVLVSLVVLVGMSYFTPLWALWGAGVFLVFRYLEASGHHRSQHLLAHLVGESGHRTGHSKRGAAGHKPQASPPKAEKLAKKKKEP